MKIVKLIIIAAAMLAPTAWAGTYELLKIEVDGGSGADRAVVRCTVTSDALKKSVDLYGVTSASTVGLTTDGDLQALIAAADGAPRPDFDAAQSFTNFWLRDTATGETKLLRSELSLADGTSSLVRATAPESHKLVRYLNRLCGTWR